MEKQQLINDAVASVENGTLVKYSASFGERFCSGVLTTFIPDMCETSDDQVVLFSEDKVFAINLNADITFEDKTYYVNHRNYAIEIEF